MSQHEREKFPDSSLQGGGMEGLACIQFCRFYFQEPHQILTEQNQERCPHDPGKGKEKKRVNIVKYRKKRTFFTAKAYFPGGRHCQSHEGSLLVFPVVTWWVSQKQSIPPTLAPSGLPVLINGVKKNVNRCQSLYLECYSWERK